MQKSILPPSLLTVAFRKETASIKKQYKLKAVVNKNAASSSHLHQLFFGSVRVHAFAQPKEEKQPGGFDDYSSYE